jgi:hypothetical protein
MVGRFKGSHHFPTLAFIEKHFFLWAIGKDTDDGIDKVFRYRVDREGLRFPGDFEERRGGALSVVRAVLHEISEILVRDHAVTEDECCAILDSHGL